MQSAAGLMVCSCLEGSAMRWKKPLPEYILAEFTSADITGLLNALIAEEIALKNIQHRNELTVRITLNSRDYRMASLLAKKYGAEVNRCQTFGIATITQRFIKRPVLTMFLLTMLFLTCYVPGRIFFVNVQGNAQVPERYILQAAAECGIDFGASRRAVRSEIMKNRLLEKIPQLQWAGINTYGCTAIISVREKNLEKKGNEPNYPVSSIVASRDGVIKSCTVFRGNVLCSVGQVVRAGQRLVSGFLDYGIVMQTTCADAEITALTIRDLDVVSPVCTAIKGDVQKRNTVYSLKIGKKLIKLRKDSGNLDATCGKIYSEEYLCLPGGFQLPVSIIKETEIRYDTGQIVSSDVDAGEWLKGAAEAYLRSAMISGEIISADAEVTLEKAYKLRGRYICQEMIGITKHEETIPKDDVK